MAAKNSVKTYTPNTFYHVYNRGVEKRKIFIDDQDFSVFLSYLHTYLTPKDEQLLQSIIASIRATRQEKDQAIKQLRLKNYASQLELHCYALLPNHFHLLLYQNESVINRFMNSLGTRYSMYFNRKYKRKGVLFQDVYKAVHVETEEQLLHLSRYIHNNPTAWFDLAPTQWQKIRLLSSVPDYLNKRHTDWLKTDIILGYFSQSNPNLSYAEFLGLPVEESLINHITLNEE